MLIKKIYIENFGTISEKSFILDRGINQFTEKNGWGKSTLAVFIKAMLYGLEDKGKRKGFFEREHYFPWNNGRFGGSIIIEHNGENFKITRYFGSHKKSEDTLEILSLKNNLPAEKILKFSEPGLFFLGIDGESFERSCFITRNKVPEVTDSINAKLNNLLEAGDDVGNYTKADEIIQKAVYEYKSPRGLGLINQQEQKIAELNEKLRFIEAKQNEYDKLKLHERELKNKIKKSAVQKNLLERNKEIFLLKKTTRDKKNQLKKNMIAVLSFALCVAAGGAAFYFRKDFFYLIISCVTAVVLAVIILAVPADHSENELENKLTYGKYKNPCSLSENCKNLEEYNEKIAEVNNRIVFLERELKHCEDGLELVEAELLLKNECLCELEKIRNSLKASVSTYDALLETQKLLKEAYENLSCKYMEKMKRSFNRYAEKISDGSNFFIDQNLNVNYDEKGSCKKSDFFSSGYKDLMNFCTRLALVDAMFAEEQPVLVLDDPFVNLDEEKIETARKIVSDISKERQILYFTCHESRKT